ncbi:uncharacterized protein LOC124834723 [Vigna umbellata]|uniref:uncharacterized protein LOC124834723 n=1 Tax=Vigna umbellata TaxID=87088 RepID=UPI001F5FB676|nr:uncharacterized protein LOC124834723 [Vigna umbellata]
MLLDNSRNTCKINWLSLSCVSLATFAQKLWRKPLLWFHLSRQEERAQDDEAIEKMLNDLSLIKNLNKYFLQWVCIRYCHSSDASKNSCGLYTETWIISSFCDSILRRILDTCMLCMKVALAYDVVRCSIAIYLCRLILYIKWSSAK